MYKKIERCRICHNTDLRLVLDLGEQMLTGVFPRHRDAKVTSGPIRLVKCMASQSACGLLQLEHSYDLTEMYGLNYGYRSGLNRDMVEHLGAKVRKIMQLVDLRDGDLVVDIGSNDSTTLRAYPSSGLTLVGVDPTGIKFHQYYPPHVQLIPDFFSADLLAARFPKRKAKVVTSFSMFYDLEAPTEFMREVHRILADDGVWVFEQSYMPTMLEMNSYDTACHEHLEYYALEQIKWMTDRVGFRILDVEFNSVNGGSFSVAVMKSAGPREPAAEIQRILDRERALGLNELAPYSAFAQRTAKSRADLRAFIGKGRSEGATLAALGASTKGNVLLQYCGFTEREISVVAEVNSEKFDCYTPGSWIPIRPEAEVLASKPDYLLVLPWHFRKFFETSPSFAGQKLVFPLPGVDVVLR